MSKRVKYTKRRFRTVLFSIVIFAVVLLGGFDNSVYANNDPVETQDMDVLIQSLPKPQDSTGFQHYYYNQLTDVQKVLYWQLLENANIDNAEISIDLKGHECNNEDIYLVSCAVKAENPWVLKPFFEQSFNVDEEGVLRLTIIESSYSDYSIRKSKAVFEKIMKTIGTGDRYTKIARLTTYINKNIAYDYDSAYLIGGNNSNDSNSLIGSLFYNTCVCEGFSMLTKAVCDEANIPCLVVTGENPSDETMGHSWAIIQMEDGKWYMYDGTKLIKGYPIDEIKNSFLFGKKTKDLEPTYGGINSIAYSDKISIPAIAEEDYIYQGTYDWDSYNEAELVFDDNEEHFYYSVNEDGESCTITKYEGKQKGNLTIPGEIDGYTVTAIGENAFYRCDGFTGSLTIPDSVITIGKFAFYDCDGFKGHLHIPANIKSIGEYAFFQCNNFTGELSLPESLEYMGKGAFSYCKGLTGDVYISSKIKEISSIFDYCESIESFTVAEDNPNYVSVDGVIYSKDLSELYKCPCTRTSLNIKSTVKTVKANACLRCNKLTELIIPNGVECIENWAFSEMRFEGNLVIPESVKKIGYAAFAREDNSYPAKGTLTLPETMEEIDAWAFVNCGFTGEVVIPKGLKSIGINIEGNEDALSVFHANEFTKYKVYCTETSVLEYLHKCFKSVGYSEEDADEILIEVMHSDAWKITRNPTCAEKGLKETYCTICNKNVTQTVPLLEHEWQTDFTIDKQPTFSDPGSKSIHCAKCGAKKDICEIPVLTNPDVTTKGQPEQAIIVNTDTEQNAETNNESTIKPQKAKIVSVKSKKKRAITISWKRDSRVSGYEIQYSTNKKFRKAKSKKSRKTSLTVRGLKKRRYYIRIRSYINTVNGKVYGKWSKSKSIKLKK